jgi:two-component system, cell cycle sensor histidine kinase and response regulator CckA
MSAPLSPLNLLLVEDSEMDAELLLVELRRNGFDVNAERVESGSALRGALASSDWQIVICDHGMPSFNSTDALSIVRAAQADLPFVVFSGSIGEEAAVEALRAGATDVVLKTNLSRVGPVVERVLEEAEGKRQRHSLEAQLRQAQKMEAIGSLVGSITHDFNNILAVVNGYAHLILQQLGEEDPLRKKITAIAIAGEKGASLTQQLLAFTRRQALEPKIVDLNKVILGIEPLLRQLVGEHVDLVIDLDPKLGCVKADESQLEQVVMNLVVNGCDAMTEGGALTVQTRFTTVDEGHTSTRSPIAARDGSYVALSVTDTGTGMDAETQDQIFEPFFTTKGVGQGTGLGLATVYGIVTQSGGHIEVASRVGFGTVFHVLLPRVIAEPQIREQMLSAQEPWRGTASILVVDDNDGVLGLVRELLEYDGFSVRAARGGDEAIEIFTRHPGSIDLVITDMMMPGMSGVDLARRLREIEPEIPLIFMSGYSGRVPDNVESFAPETTTFIQKPLNPTALNLKVRELLDTS